jgi:hypothetical protein
MNTRTAPEFIRDGLFTRCVCPHDGTAMHVTASGFWECNAALHRWTRLGGDAWKLLKTWARY